jgi:hypothetical protein
MKGLGFFDTNILVQSGSPIGGIPVVNPLPPSFGDTLIEPHHGRLMEIQPISPMIGDKQ